MKKLQQKYIDELKSTLKACEIEEKETSISFKCTDRNVILKLLTKGYIQLSNALLFLDILRRYDVIIYGSVLKEYEKSPVELAAIKMNNASLEICEEMNKKFEQVIIYPNGSVVWMQPSKE